MHIFDDLDRQLLAILRADGRAPVAGLAGALGVSRATVQSRLDRLLESGAILGFTVRAREHHDSIRAIMLIEVAGKSTSAVIRSLRSVPELHALHTTNGAWDLIAEIRTDTLESFDRVLREVRVIDGVLNSETSLMLSTI
ncbi:Lrp/AsnC family transcriptional regulator [Acetobacter fallax]|uniref:AsnC family transcriptional regulator n=1 Tax=Acetobacter fallax TaxID=1737473 RepID=A0ABX0KBC7_9PROT|nr:Lrp/AsnC family transcriptional regulator [Acetobacter fallax]NHO32336.1 AsnC family transcriptional regulator [Acetobacter fallax]NHO35895.1 AsnC family transcriptional regulator [Acetobacter fallax]